MHSRTPKYIDAHRPHIELSPEEAAVSVLSPLTTTRPFVRRLVGSGTAALGVLEAMATPHGLDRYLELVHPMLTVRELRAEVVSVHHSTADSVTLTLRPTRQWRGFRAGQFVNVTVDIDGVRRTRCYSPSCSQHLADGTIEITVKAHPEGLVSTYLHDHARPGLVVGLSPADGSFTLPARRPERLLLLSGGSGITPVLSMLRTLADEGHTGEVVFLHYADGPRTIAQRAAVEAIARRLPNVRVVWAYTVDEVEEAGSVTGLFGQAHLDAALGDAASGTSLEHYETYLCGPPPLMRAVRAHVADAGLEHRLHVEEFQPSLTVVPDGDASGTISFARSGASGENSGATLLEQAEAAGLKPEFGCRMGICFSCTQVKTSGCTRDIRTGETNADPDTEIQLCVSVPVGDVAIDV